MANIALGSTQHLERTEHRSRHRNMGLELGLDEWLANIRCKYVGNTLLHVRMVHRTRYHNGRAMMEMHPHKKSNEKGNILHHMRMGRIEKIRNETWEQCLEDMEVDRTLDRIFPGTNALDKHGYRNRT